MSFQVAVKGIASRLGRKLRAFIALGSATAATEFAIILPVMLTTYLGSVEVGGGITVDRKLANLSLTLANLTARANGALQDSDVNGILNASAAVLTPYNSAQVGMVVTSIVFDNSNPPKAFVVWSDANGPGVVAMTPNCTLNLSTTVVPNSLRTANGSVILAQAKFPYVPAIGYVVSGTVNLSETNFMVPRNMTSVPRTNSNGTTYTTCTGGQLA